MNDLENLAQTILNLKAKVDMLTETLSATTDELKDVDKIMPLVDKLIHTDVKFYFKESGFTKEEAEKLSTFVKDYMLDRYGV